MKQIANQGGFSGRRLPGRVTRRLALLSLIAACALAVLGVSGASGGTVPAATHGSRVTNGGVLRVGTSYPIDSLNPFVAQADYSYMTFEYIYPELTQYNAKLQIVPDFAVKWKHSANGRTWTFHTRPSAKWSDGQPLTAADAAWTINTEIKFQNGPTAAAAGVVSHIKHARALNATTLVVHYKKAISNVLAQFQGLNILPKHIWSKYATGNGKGLKRFQNDAPIVSGGPFVLTKYTKNQIALFSRNPYWWGPKPHIQGFGLQFFSNNDAMISALEQGSLDFIGEYTPPTAVKALRAHGLIVSTKPSVSFKDFIINTNPKKKTHRELLNPLVREALEYATDRSQIINTAWLGFAQPGSTIVAPAAGSWHNPHLKPLPFNLAKANKLLDKAGYKMGSNGVRIADGHPMSYNVIFPPDEKGTGDRTFAILQTDWKKIGIAIHQKNMDDAATFNAISAPKNKYLNFDMAMWDWVPPVAPDFILSVLTCGQFGDWSDSGYCNKTYDKMYARQGTLLNKNKRRKLIWRMQKLVYNQRPYIVLEYPDVIEAHTKQWTGFVLSPVMGSINSLSMQTLLQVHKVG